MSPRSIKIALAGSSGLPGRFIVPALLQSSDLIVTLTILRRSPARDGESTNPNVREAIVDYHDSSSLIAALAGQDVVISGLNAEPAPVLDGLLLSACIAASTPSCPIHFINGYTLDIMHPSARRFCTPSALGPKIAFAERLQKEGEAGNITWSTIVNASFLDYCLVKGYTGIDLGTRNATLYDGGQNIVTGCSLAFVGHAVAEVVSLWTDTENGRKRVQNQRIKVAETKYSGGELLRLVQDAVGGEEFEVREESTEDSFRSGSIIRGLNWDGSGAAYFEDGLEFGHGILQRRTLREIVRDAIEAGEAPFK